ncbi:DUF937 domain-containing protein [Microvirga sp. GCM10011540]|uniref:DUF937 domain-containing protein n=1 Tax=Microvirga sp. GCM10011540 TaxID=3317338 RepID=UPI003606130B
MFNWFDLMRQAQTSAGFDMLARQYHLSGDQTQRAMAALLPAFAMGLQHAASPNDPSRLMQTMMSNAYQNFWQGAGQSFSAQAQQEGRRLLDQLFGSDDVTRRVAHQAADYVGVSVETMQQILPLMTGILAGGMYQWMAHQGRAFQAAATPQQQGRENPADPWAQLWAIWMNAATPEKKPAANPFEEMMAGFMQQPAPPPPDPAPSAAPWDDMMEKGRDMQRQYLASLQSIFEDASKPPEK